MLFLGNKLKERDGDASVNLASSNVGDLGKLFNELDSIQVGLENID